MGILTQNYEIIKEIGRGGTGSVHLAKDKRLDRMVAVKILELDNSLDEEVIKEIIQRFHKEARAIARLKHGNIVDIYDFGEEDGKHFMVIELLDGVSLAEKLIKKEKLSIPEIIDIGIQLCDALEYAHKNNIVHRDIKPGNVILLKDNKIKLTDFGIAQLGNDKLILTQAGSILGSILYIPPEQLVDSRKVDKRADIYSLGVTLYQLFTGRLPFEGTSVGDVITKILNQEIPSMKKFNKSIPDALDRIILKAMKKEPSERYEDIGYFGEALKDVAEYYKNPNHAINIERIDNYSKPKQEKKSDKNAKKVTGIFNILINSIMVISVGTLIAVIAGAIYYFGFRNNITEKTIPEVVPSIISSPTVQNTVSAVPVETVKPTEKPKQTPKPVKTSKPVIIKKVLKPIEKISPVISRPIQKKVISVKKPAPMQKVNKPITHSQNKKLGEGY